MILLKNSNSNLKSNALESKDELYVYATSYSSLMNQPLTNQSKLSKLLRLLTASASLLSELQKWRSMCNKY